MAEGGWFSNDTATFGDRVAGAREVLGLTQGDLARRLGVKLKTVKSWEEDLAEPRANKLQMLSGILNVSLVWLLTGEGDGLDGPSEGYEMSADVTALFGEMRELKAQMNSSAERLGRLEKRLRTALHESAA